MITHPVLSRLANAGVRLGLERVREFLQVLGEPQHAYAVVHVAGTNGKGSVTAMVAHALREAGYTVGANFSPHTSQVNERIWIDGKPIGDALLSDLLEEVDRARREWAETARIDGEALTYFELITCTAFLAFARAGVDIAVIETGMGGRLDATNVVNPQVVAISTIGLDHSEQLGDTLAKIAFEKAGIFKKSAAAVIGPMDSSAKAVFVRRAQVLKMQLWQPGPDMRRSFQGGTWSFTTPEGELSGVRLALEGLHQGANATVALGALHLLRGQGFPVDDDAVRRGFETVWLPGRLEQLRPGLWVDGAHNLPGMEAVARWLTKRARPEYRILLIGMGHGRDPETVVQPLLSLVDEVVTTHCAHPKARSSFELGTLLGNIKVPLFDGGPIEEALPDTYQGAYEVIVVGSLYLAGAVRDLVTAGALDDLDEE